MKALICYKIRKYLQIFQHPR